MKIYLTSIAIFAYIISGNTQNKIYNYGSYYQNIIIAKQKILTDSIQKQDWKTDSVDYYYQQAFKLQPPFPNDLINYAWYSYSKRDFKNAKNSILDAVRNGYQYYPESYEKANAIVDYTVNRRDTISEFGRFKDSVIVPKYDSLRTLFLKRCTEIDYFNVMLIQEMYFQRGRGAFIHDTILDLENEQIFKIQIHLENYPIAFLIKLMRDNNFPDRRKTRNYSNEAIYIILIHEVIALKEEDSKEFFELLWREVIKGNIQPRDYATLYDKYYTADLEFPHKVSTFGTTIAESVFIDGVLHGGQMKDVKNPEKINELRRKHFLLPIEDYAKSFGYGLPINYRKTDD